ERWVNRFDSRPPEVQADIIAMLGPGRASVAMLMPYVESEHQPVRAAAAQAVASIGGDEALSGLMDALFEAQNPKDIATLKSALLQLPTDALVSKTAASLPSADGYSKAALIDMLATRRANDYLDSVLNALDDSEQQVRMAVYSGLGNLMKPKDVDRLPALLESTQTADEREALLKSVAEVAGESDSAAASIVESMNDLSAEQKVSVMTILPEIGGPKALDAVVQASNNSNSSVKKAANKALAAWPEPSAIAPLFEAFKDASGAGRKPLLQGYIRLVGQSKYAAEDKVQFLKDAYAAASSVDEKGMILKAFAGLESPKAFKLIAANFKDKNSEIREQSLRAAARFLAQSAGESEQQLAMIEATTSTQTRDKIAEYLQQFQSGDQKTNHFTSLFNEEDLSDWVGDKDSYHVEDGKLISKDGAAGNLFTEQEYSNFILRFDFKLTPGANNGLGIRAPLEGNPAYDAMELQIIDNSAEKYADLEPYQYHGSVYGVDPAERGYLNPPGEWNSQEVIADGSQITVKVNGETILEADLQEAAKPETMDGKDHPGLFRESGHIGFLGHADQVAFRNIRI